MTLAARIKHWFTTVRRRRKVERTRRAEAVAAMKAYHAAKGTPAEDDRLRAYNTTLQRLKVARVDLARAEKKLKELRSTTGKPRIVPSGIATRAVFGPLGPELRATTHYAASGRAKNLAEGLRLARFFHQFHASKGWGGLSYHYLIPDSGEIILGRPVTQKGAHVANTNSNNVGINFFCTAGHRPTEAQRKSAQWLIANAHTSALPKSHRTDRDLRKAQIRGHNQWPGQSTGCPGFFKPSDLGLR